MRGTDSSIVAESGKVPGARNWWRSILLDWDKTQLLGSLLIIFLISLSPLVMKSPYYMNIIILTILYAYMGISWNVVAGFAGQLLIAHVIFIGVGAYTTIILLERLGVTPWLGIPASAVTAALLGAFVSFITLRYGLKQDYFALFTIALMTTMRLLFLKSKLVGSAEGMWVSFRGESLQKMIFIAKAPYLYIALGLLLIGVVVQYKVYRSKVGKYLLAIREDESAAAALGVNTALYKTVAVLLAAALAGMGGGFYVLYITFVDPPQVYNLALAVEMAIAAPIIGGLGTLLGPILGAILNKPAVELIRGWLAAGRAGSSLIVYGVMLIVFILFMPQGIVGLLHGPYEKLRHQLLAREIRKE